MSGRVVSMPSAASTTRPAGVAPWPYLEYMARWERQVERRQLFLRSYHFSRDDADADHAPSSSARARRARRVVWVGLRRLRRAAATGLRRLRARLRLCFGWATRRRSSASTSYSVPLRRRRCSSGGGGLRYGRLYGFAGKARNAADSACFW